MMRWKRNPGILVVLLALVLAGCAGPRTTATPVLTPAPAAPALLPAQSPVDISGVWRLRVMSSGDEASYDCTFALQEDGTYTIDVKGGMHIEAGTYTIRAGTLTLDSNECYASGTFYHCVGTYKASSSKVGGRPALLRLEMVEDKGDRSRSLNNKTLELDKP